MRTAIDTNVFTAIWSGESAAERLVAQLGEAKQEGALLISPFVFAELHSYPGATENFIRDFIESTGVMVDYRMDEKVWAETGRRFARYVHRRSQSSEAVPTCLLADFLIGAHALVQADRLLTLDPRRYIRHFPEIVFM